ncbi:MAG: SGNH/GDSL hydrolase family protein [Faecalibacterium sp.]|nr:SGNH/GDSL hydrolase family protein [Faecalibacterium sp.]
MYQTPLTAALRPDGTCLDEIDLDTGRLREKLRMMNSLTDAALLGKFDSAAGFRSVVAGIGISVSSDALAAVQAEWILFGKKSRYGSGTHLTASCPADGRETVLWLDDAVWSDDDYTSGQLRFFFEKEGQTAQATVLLYVRPSVEFPQASLEAPVDFAAPAYQELLARSLYSRGNNARLKKAFARAQRGEEITLAFLGGSITQGAGAKPIHTQCYSYQAWQKTQALLGHPVQFVKAGIGGTPSELGMIRLERDILRKGTPDILVIEFAVNDNDDETQGRCYESLIRKALSLPGEPAVVLLFSVFCDDWNLQDRCGPIGRYYDLPMVSVLDAVVPQFGLDAKAGGVISKRQYFYDSYHPTNDGHRVMADCLVHLFHEVGRAEADAPISMPEKSCTGRTFEDVRLLDRAHILPGAAVQAGDFAARDENLQGAEMDDVYRATPQFRENWMHEAGAGTAPFALRVRCKSAFLVEKDSSEDTFGAADVFVDGKLCRTVDPHTVGWIHCGALLLFESDTPAEHEIVIRMAEQDADKAFTILGFGVC